MSVNNRGIKLLLLPLVAVLLLGVGYQFLIGSPEEGKIVDSTGSYTGDAPAAESSGSVTATGTSSEELTVASTCADWLSANRDAKVRLIDNLDFSTIVANTRYDVAIPATDKYCPSHRTMLLQDALYYAQMKGPNF